jgi:hypothetical protein
MSAASAVSVMEKPVKPSVSAVNGCMHAMRGRQEEWASLPHAAKADLLEVLSLSTHAYPFCMCSSHSNTPINQLTILTEPPIGIMQEVKMRVLDVAESWGSIVPSVKGLEQNAVRAEPCYTCISATCRSTVGGSKCDGRVCLPSDADLWPRRDGENCGHCVGHVE